MRYLIIMLCVANAACSSPSKQNSYFKDDSYVITNDSIKPAKRLYLIHGLRSSKEMWTKEPYKTFIASLDAKGIQTIAITLPYAQGAMFADGGMKYALEYKLFVASLLERINAKYGVADETLVGGISFGGLHALMAVELMPSAFNAYFAVVPVVGIGALDEFKGIQTPAFNPLANPRYLAAKPGLIIWGNQDMRVDYRLTQVLADNILDNSPVSFEAIEVQGMGHTSRPENLEQVATWVAL